MKILELINGNGYEVIVSLLLANFIAQFIKTSVFALRRKKINMALFFATGGMPSSHSSTVTGMTTTIGLLAGFDSLIFALAACISGIVMFDAAGVRMAASKQAIVLNKIIREILSPDSIVSKERMKEFLGHTPTQVFAGAALGMAVAVGLRELIEHHLGEPSNLIPFF